MAQKKRYSIVGNWKMNPDTLDKAKKIFAEERKTIMKLRTVDAIICPPSMFLAGFAAAAKKPLSIGSQDVFWQPEGSYTGQVSPTMLKKAGVSYAIIGHSERRALGETNEQVAKKTKAAIEYGLKAIVCVGEESRDEHGHHINAIRQQLKESLAQVTVADLKKVSIAYEPVWAIGKSDKDAMKPTQIHEMSIFIKKVIAEMHPGVSIKVPILYGGSVTSRISNDILIHGDIDGLLIGRQSLDPKEFSEILRNADSI
jgi:triosephosphate isomerase (TIM)